MQHFGPRLHITLALGLAFAIGALEPEDDDVVHKAVQGVYLLDRANRRLSTDVPALLRIKKQARVVAAAKRGPKPRIAAA